MVFFSSIIYFKVASHTNHKLVHIIDRPLLDLLLIKYFLFFVAEFISSVFQVILKYWTFLYGALVTSSSYYDEAIITIALLGFSDVIAINVSFIVILPGRLSLVSIWNIMLWCSVEYYIQEGEYTPTTYCLFRIAVPI